MRLSDDRRQSLSTSPSLLPSRRASRRHLLLLVLVFHPSSRDPEPSRIAVIFRFPFCFCFPSCLKISVESLPCQGPSRATPHISQKVREGRLCSRRSRREGKAAASRQERKVMSNRTRSGIGNGQQLILYTHSSKFSNRINLICIKTSDK